MGLGVPGRRRPILFREPFRPRMRVIPLLLCCMSGSGLAAGLPPLQVDPALLLPGTPVARPAAAPAQTAPVEPSTLPASAPTETPLSETPPAASAPAPTSSKPGPAAAPDIAPQAAQPLPPGTTLLDADSMEGVQGETMVAHGRAVLRRDGMRLSADSISYAQVEDLAKAEGKVVLVKGDTRIAGPSAELAVGDQVGEFLSPEYTMSRIRRADSASRLGGARSTRVSGGGKADVLHLEGENQYRLENATWSTCKATDPDWYLRAKDLKLDYDREVGEASGSSLIFKGVPLFYSPWMDFPLANQRQSGFLAPTFGTSNKTGADLSLPYYWNIAPNYDATLTPRWMARRGMQLGGEFRYLTDNASGATQLEWLPHDDVTGGERAMGSIRHTQTLAPGLVGSVNLNGVSDKAYFSDLSSNLSVTTKNNLLREGRLSYSTGSWWQTSVLLQSYQVLEGSSPYRRMPQLLFTGENPYLPGGLDFAMRAEYVDFSHPDANYVEGRRVDLHPQLSLPIEGAAYFVTPKVAFEYTGYSLDQSSAYTGRTSLTRSLPYVSVDSGLVFERDTEYGGAAFTQTLEPRLYYLYVPYRKQDDFPVFDTALYDFSFAQLFADNQFIGADRVSNANEITAAAVSRLIAGADGDEVMRVALGQRYYFDDQRVTLPGYTVPTGKRTDYLAAFSGKIAKHAELDTGWQYNPEDDKTQRFNFGLQYKPDFAKVVNVNYRYTRDVLRDLDVSGQWPLFGSWYGVARYTRSLRDHRLTEALAGLEYDAGCWVFRTAFHRFATTERDVTQAFFIQLELNGLASVGSSPLNLLKRSVSGYGVINQNVGDPVFGAAE